jgi:hypothetical protein
MTPLTQKYTRKRVCMRIKIMRKKGIITKMKIMIMPRRASKWYKIKP